MILHEIVNICNEKVKVALKHSRIYGRDFFTKNKYLQKELLPKPQEIHLISTLRKIVL